ncbi:hypothetical protein AUR65_015905 [Haloferax marisrubri]|uniref:Uncharacterized protein n=1 Tax=Haloferax marisrubri TaxID=1544719 RepID=A0A2P4NLY9_9EURY|nr:hypothetical protein AUR65_015905 [Haloferax marisrubri]
MFLEITHVESLLFWPQCQTQREPPSRCNLDNFVRIRINVVYLAVFSTCIERSIGCDSNVLRMVKVGF